MVPLDYPRNKPFCQFHRFNPGSSTVCCSVGSGKIPSRVEWNQYQPVRHRPVTLSAKGNSFPKQPRIKTPGTNSNYDGTTGNAFHLLPESSQGGPSNGSFIQGFRQPEQQRHTLVIHDEKDFFPYKVTFFQDAIKQVGAPVRIGLKGFPAIREFGQVPFLTWVPSFRDWAHRSWDPTP